MLYLHDVWVNWFEEDNPNLIPYYHEWKKDDTVGLMDQLPLIKVNTNLFNYITFGSNEMGKIVLNGIANKGYHRKNHERVPEKYAFVCSDGTGVMAIILDANGNVKKKSRLIPRQFQMVIEMIESDKNNFELAEEFDISYFKTYFGLTRLEKSIASNILDFIENLLPENASLLKYLVSEWDYNLNKKLQNSSFNEIKNKLINEIKIDCENKLTDFNKLIGKIKVVN